MGHASLWEIALDAKNAVVAKAATTFLNEIIEGVRS